MQKFLKHVVLYSALVGCSTAATPDLDQADQAVTCPVPTIDPTRSLEVTDATALASFSFQRVMSAITTSAHATNTPRQLWTQWMNTFADCNDPKIDPNGYGIVCPRVESTLASINPFNLSGQHFTPTALANRFDLAPKSGADCGEYRIVFAMVGGPPQNGRAFVIFEGRLPNPTPSQGLAGCAPVADFWAQLSTDPDPASRAGKLDQFYFTGIPGFPPVVDAAHYGLTTTDIAIAGPRKGQIRTNMFVNNVQWNLREFQLAKPCAATASCALSVEHVTDKVNPANELFTGTSPNAPAFQAAFLSQIAPLSRGKAATITMTNADRFNEFESVSSGASDVLYANFTEPSFQAQIAAHLTDPNLTVTNILDRATTQTCAGCHQLSTSPPHNQLGEGVVWPQSLGFVQINEQSTLSPALLNVFLPQRSAVLTGFLKGQCSGVSITDDGGDLGGGAIDAAN
ncbi:MAG TPA: hypothetical protein VHW23_01125 [Kofleriaceae bacterium]|jgi:hypothetical protein|nr:hypothetical protein [Kofleriaceae bacterium]